MDCWETAMFSNTVPNGGASRLQVLRGDGVGALLASWCTRDLPPGQQQARRPHCQSTAKPRAHACNSAASQLGGKQGMLRPGRRRRAAAQRIPWCGGDHPTLFACCVLPSQVMRAASGSVTGRATLNRTCRARNARTLRQVSLTGTCQGEGDVSRG
jgi:hypothetical protein